MELAEKTNGVILNADSMQIYRDLRILTARPTPEDEAAAEHRLYGMIDGAENFSVGRYAAMAAAELDLLRSIGRLPIITGGTGLYFKALEEGLSNLPPVSAQLREEIRAWAQDRATPELHAALSVRDPQTAFALRPSDRLRVLRALEFHAATGGSLAAAQGRKEPGPLSGKRLLKLFLAPDRSWLHERIDRRFRAMVAQGALAEVEALATRCLDPALPIMRAHGAPALMAHLRGELTLDNAIARGQADTRAYVKRQFTWFRHQMPGWLWLSSDAERAEALRQVNAERH